jgi:transcriptional regulator with XRE-family HTH domain
MSRKRVKPTEAGQTARAWRERLGMSSQALADATGYSLEALYQYERGKRHDGTRLSQWAWQRYQMACAGVAAELKGEKFQW